MMRRLARWPRQPWPRLLALPLGLSLVASACSGGGDDSGSAPRDEGDAPAEVDTSAPVAGAAEPDCEGTSDGVLRIGGLVPETGGWQFAGRAQRAAAQLAVSDVNAAQGVLGQEVIYTAGNEGEPASDTALRTVEAQIEGGADVIVGATSEGASFSVMGTIAEACVIQFSPANTSTEFATQDEHDLYFRTAPSNALQGRALADLMRDEGNRTAAVLGVERRYGRELRELTGHPFEAGGGQVVLDRGYDPDDDDPAALADEIVAANPDALMLAGLDETGAILQALFERGFTPDAKNIYLPDSNMNDATGEAVAQPGALAGIRGAVPGSATSTELRNRLVLGVDQELADFSFVPETYDAIVITALAAEAAGTDDPAQVARQINGVTRDGEVCTSYAQCKLMIAGGADIDYDGPSGPQAFSRAGEPTVASFAIVTFGEDNRIDANQTEFRQAALG
jgi:ABC-type branched-subunit amino acid transport system substrate-binding protein